MNEFGTGRQVVKRKGVRGLEDRPSSHVLHFLLGEPFLACSIWLRRFTEFHIIQHLVMPVYQPLSHDYDGTDRSGEGRYD